MLKLATPPAVEPVSLEEAKAHLRLDLDEDDALVGRLVSAARQWCELATRRAFVDTAFDLCLDGFPPCRGPIKVGRSGLRSVASVQYLAADGTDTTLAPSAYAVVAGDAGRIVPAYGTPWPAHRRFPESVRVRLTIGYGTSADDVPACVKQAILLLVGHWYENREQVLVGTISKSIEFAADALLDPVRWGHYS